jgi:ABC-type glycerol-3-phosphate transport system substrate-binding protein
VRAPAVGVLAISVILGASACGGSKKSANPETTATVATRTGARASIKGSITFDGIRTASSGQKQFADVIAAFNEKYPNVKVR